MERAYREDELLDSIVIDSEGCIYGRVGKIRVKEDEISLLVYETKPDEKTVPDIGALKEELLKGVKLTLGAKLQKLSRDEILAQSVQKEFGLKLEEPPTDEYLIKYAERFGINVPYTKVLEERRESKGFVTLREVRSIGISTIGSKESSDLVKVVLLQEPKEAAFRKIPVQKTIPYKSTETIKDKLVIDAKGLAIGCVDSVVLFRNTPGIRVYALKPSDSVSLSWLTRYLEKIGRPDIVEAMMKYFKIERGEHIYRLRMTDLEDFMRRVKFNFKVPDDFLIDRNVKEFVLDIPWEMVHKIGDVVILRKELSEIQSQGY
jgi:sporulation protein YlmC with PRC-barrel domain